MVYLFISVFFVFGWGEDLIDLAAYRFGNGKPDAGSVTLPFYDAIHSRGCDMESIGYRGLSHVKELKGDDDFFRCHKLSFEKATGRFNNPGTVVP
jgi:hypothetical protein